jgi:3-oxoisoapionate kinase
MNGPLRLFCFYGDDFTGSTDALEALAANGVPSVLFLDPPGEAALATFPDCQAIGIAGESRSRTPEWMIEHLPEVFRRLRQYGAPVCQYKVCSTFDSSPHTGSIGRALEIGQDVFATPWVPVVPAAPHLGRYALFGNLFASGGGAVHRIDRHPTMRHHPVTPMEEADLVRHLALQTSRPVSLLDLNALRSGSAEQALRHILEQQHPAAVLFDGLDDATVAATGRLLAAVPPAAQYFAVGSSGLTHAIIRHWQSIGVAPQAFAPPQPAPVDRLIVVSGSCSPVTEGQIRWATTHGFAAFPWNRDREGAVFDAALAALASGRSVILYTALGPRDCDSATGGGPQLGCALGCLLRDLLLRSGVRRALIAGGDTSTFAVRQLGITALTFAGLTVPGAPLCRCHSPEAPGDALELVLKGGQIGPQSYFEQVRTGRPLPC